MGTTILNLFAKILYYLHSRIQVYLRSCTEVKIMNDAKLAFLDWSIDLMSLILGYGHIMSIVDLPFLLISY